MNPQGKIDVGDKVVYVDFRQHNYNPIPIGVVTEVIYHYDRFFYKVKWDNLGYSTKEGEAYADFQVAKLLMPGDQIDDSFIQDEKDDMDAADWWKN